MSFLMLQGTARPGGQRATLRVLCRDCHMLDPNPLTVLMPRNRCNYSALLTLVRPVESST